MPIPVPQGASMLFIRRPAYERSGLTRSAIDDRLALSADEFQVEGDLVAIGPLPEGESLVEFIDELERTGLTYFDDFFELSGNWPEWLRLFASSTPRRG